jgi:hypothetical protein
LTNMDTLALQAAFSSCDLKLLRERVVKSLVKSPGRTPWTSRGSAPRHRSSRPGRRKLGGRLLFFVGREIPRSKGSGQHFSLPP